MSVARLFVHSLEASRLGDGLGVGLGQEVLRKLSQRAVLLSGGGDTVLVDAEVDPAWLKWLGGIGLEVGEVRVAGGAGETLVDRVMGDRKLMGELVRGDWVVEPYMGGEGVRALAQEVGGRGSSFHGPEVGLLDRLNLKSNLGPILHEVGLPAVATTIAHRESVVSVARAMLPVYGSLIVRSDLSIGGHGVWMVDRESDLEALGVGTLRASARRLYVIQPKLGVTSSPNVQYDIGEDGAELLGVSDQSMTASMAFGGNDFPSAMGDDAGLLGQGGKLAAWLHGAGYRGIVGIDFIVSDEGKVHVVEINPRVNTSTFPLVVSRRLGCGAFSLVTGIGAGGVRGFSGVRKVLGDSVLFDPGRGDGVVPLMVPSTERGVLDVMVLGDTRADVDRVRGAMDARLREHGLVGAPA